MQLADVDTPALVIDLDALRRNIAVMADIAATAGVALRPHAKSHKSAAIAKLQISAGAVGLCCQTVSEAEALVASGIGDVLVTNEVVGERKLARLATLAGRARIAVLADDPGAIVALERSAAASGNRIDVLVELETGDRRAGVDAAVAAGLARLIAGCSHLRFAGLQAYKGSTEHVFAAGARREAWDEVFAEVRRAQVELAAAGLACPKVTGGGTGTAALIRPGDPLTELQPGSYIFMDGNYALLRAPGGGPCDTFEPSLFLLATVMTRTAADRALINAGTKAISLEAGLPVLPDCPGVRYVRGDDEHGRLVVEAGARPLALGERIRLVPSNCDPTVNLHDWFVVAQGGVVVDVWPVTARGAVF